MENVLENTPISLLRVIPNDAKESAIAAGLKYVNTAEAGFYRVRKGTKFIYMDGMKILRDTEHLERIMRLVLPPAWENVWICKISNGHVQATGFDKNMRKQYRYHVKWGSMRNQTKFYRLKEFGEKLPEIRQNLERDLRLRGYPQNKVLAAMVSLLEKINIRVGSAFYEKLYDSIGLTTLKNHHVKIDGSTLHLMFKGKKGVHHNIKFSSKKLATIISGCKEIPGKELFEYYDEQGTIRIVDSGMINNYIKEISVSDFTAKDFRTWAGTVHALLAFKEVGRFDSAGEMNRKIPEALDLVAKHLGNTRAVCKKYYVHPLIINLYQGGILNKYINKLNSAETVKDTDRYVPEEKILLKILRDSLNENKKLKKLMI